MVMCLIVHIDVRLIPLGITDVAEHCLGLGKIAPPDHQVNVAHGSQGDVTVDHCAKVRALENDDGDTVTAERAQHPSQIMVKSQTRDRPTDRDLAQYRDGARWNHRGGSVGFHAIVE